MLSVKALNTEYKTHRGPPVKAANNVSFDVPKGKFFTLLGPSGCGKTTTLRSIAGLEIPTSGEISVENRLVYSSKGNIFVPPNRRNFGMVFQSYAIWPHMTVYANAAFPLEVRKGRMPRAKIKDKVMAVLSAVALDRLADREATKLSGGQQQRLALARALVMEPELLLLDEPLSNLDAKLRDRMRFELKRIQRELGLTTIYVTHDQGEALALSHEIAVMNEGRIIQVGSPRAIYEHPTTKFVAEFIGASNFIEGAVIARSDEPNCYRIQSPIGNLSVYSDAQLSASSSVTISVRPEDVELDEDVGLNKEGGLSKDMATGEDGPNRFTGVVSQKIYLGDFVDLQVKVGEFTLLSRAHPTLRTPVGDRIKVRMNPNKCVALPAER